MAYLIRVIFRLALRYPLGQLIIGALLTVLGLYTFVEVFAAADGKNPVVGAILALVFLVLGVLLVLAGLKNMKRSGLGGSKTNQQPPSYVQSQAQQPPSYIQPQPYAQMQQSPSQQNPYDQPR